MNGICVKPMIAKCKIYTWRLQILMYFLQILEKLLRFVVLCHMLCYNKCIRYG